jgi:hypothetical protein
VCFGTGRSTLPAEQCPIEYTRPPLLKNRIRISYLHSLICDNSFLASNSLKVSIQNYLALPYSCRWIPTYQRECTRDIFKPQGGCSSSLRNSGTHLSDYRCQDPQQKSLLTWRQNVPQKGSPCQATRYRNTGQKSLLLGRGRRYKLYAPRNAGTHLPYYGVS